MSNPALCELCGKEPAAVYILKKNGDAEREQALCLRCARKQNIPSVRAYWKRQKRRDAAIQMCEQCGELPATVFAVLSKNGKEQEKQALCGFCAREKGIQPVTEKLARMEISDEELRQIHTELLHQAQETQAESFWQKLRNKIKKS